VITVVWIYKHLVLIPIIVALAFGAAQLVPYRVSNPPVQAEPVWDSPRTRALVVTACYDCHSNQTRSHWYTKMAPMSWLAARDVQRGRAALNFSEWATSGGERDLAGAVADGNMPPSRYFYFGLHKDAKLSATERDDLIRGLQAIAAQGGGHGAEATTADDKNGQVRAGQ
jgi:hypothetical protein